MTTQGAQGSIGIVGVVGLGTMGAGIAEAVAKSGFQVIAIESDGVALAAAETRIRESIDRAFAREKISEAQRAGILDRA